MATPSALAVATDRSRDRVEVALAALERDGVVERVGRSYSLADG